MARKAASDRGTAPATPRSLLLAPFVAMAILFGGAAGVSGQTVFLPPRAFVNGPAGFAGLYARQGEGRIFFGANVSYGRQGFEFGVEPGAHAGFDVRAVDRTVAMIVARYRLRRPAAPLTGSVRPEPPDAAPAGSVPDPR